MAANPAESGAEELGAQQRKRAEALPVRLDPGGGAQLDGTPDSLERLDTLLSQVRESMDAADRDRLAELVGAYAGEALLTGSAGRWVLDDAGLPAVELAGRARVRVTRRAQRLLRGDGDGMAALHARVSATAGSSPVTGPPVGSKTAPDARPHPHPSSRPLGEDRPLGLRRSAFRDVDAERGSEPSADEGAAFRRLAADAQLHTRSRGFGPSPFVWFLILCIVAVIAWAAYMYRNAPP